MARLDRLGPRVSRSRAKNVMAVYLAKKTSGTTQSAFLNAGRGNPNWAATTPREGFFLLVAYPAASASSVSAICRRNGAGSSRCSDSIPNSVCVRSNSILGDQTLIKIDIRLVDEALHCSLHGL
jgi:hypothetical protein